MVSDKLDDTHIFPFRRIRGKLNPRVSHLLPLALAVDAAFFAETRRIHFPPARPGTYRDYLSGVEQFVAANWGR